jgi:hypothetical protein
MIRSNQIKWLHLNQTHPEIELALSAGFEIQFVVFGEKIDCAQKYLNRLHEFRALRVGTRRKT